MGSLCNLLDLRDQKYQRLFLKISVYYMKFLIESIFKALL